MNIPTLIFQAAIIENIVLIKFLGLCPFFGNSKSTKDAIGMGVCVWIVTVIAAVLTSLLYQYILVPNETEYLSTLSFILVIACVVQMNQMIMKRFFSSLHKSLGIYLPLITTNCAVLGVSLLSVNLGYSLPRTIIYSTASGAGFILVLYVFTTMREYIDTKPIPKYFKGIPIALITAAIMSLLFGSYAP
jgi:Predicted NADH:ubiquinone oxidoreductase, subunit RnfA